LEADSLLALLVGLAYVTAGLLLALSYYRSSPPLRYASLGLAVLAIVGHALIVWQNLATPLGWDVNFINILALASLMVIVLLLLSSIGSHMLEAAVIALPGAALCVWLIGFASPTPVILSRLAPMVELHVFCSLLAYGLLSIAAMVAILLAAQEYLLRHPRKIRHLELLPPLAVLETLLFRMIMGGWLVLTVSLLTGLTFIENLVAQHLVHKTTLTTLSWILFGLLLAGRWWYGWRGRRAVNLTLIAMLVLILGYFGSKFVLEVLLDRTWTSMPSGEMIGSNG
jgi:ABC-type uncharacterized transport system permease subunit